MALATLTIDIDARLANLERDLGKVARLSEQAGNRMDSAFRAAGLSIAGLASGLTVGGFAAFIKSSIDAADRLGDLSKVTGLLPSQLAGIGYAAEQSGTNLEGAAQAISKLSENMGKDADKFAKIGVTAKDPIEAFKQLADVFNSIEDPQKRSALATEALGKSWREVAPLLAEGGRNIGDMVDKGMAMSGNIDELSKNSDIFKDKLAELQKQINASGGALANELLPGLIAMVDELNKMAASGNNFLPVGAAIKTVFETLVVLGANTGYVFKQVGNEIGGIGAQLAALAHGDFDGVSRIGKMMKEDAERARKEIDAFSERILNPKKPQQDGTPGKDEVKKDTGGVSDFINNPGREKADKNATSVLAMQNEEFRKQMELLGVSSAQVKVYELAMNGATKAQIEQAQAAADSIGLLDAQIKAEKDHAKAVEEANRIIFDINPMAKLQAEWEKLISLKEQGLLTDEQVGKAYQKTFADISKSGDESFKSLENAVRGWGSQFTDEMTKMVRTGKLNFSSLADSIINDLIRIQIQKSVTDPLLKAGTNFLGSIFGGGWDYSSVAPGALSFAGGGYTGSGSRSGGIDGMGGFPAILHPNETVIDHTLGQGVAAPNVVIQMTNNGQPVSVRQNGQPQFDGRNWVLGIVLDAADSDPNFRNAMGIGRA